MNLSDVISELRQINEPVPSPLPLPSEEDLSRIEKEVGITLHSDLKRFLLEASDVTYGVKEPITISKPDAHTHFPAVVNSAREYGVPEDLVPICEDNADFYCQKPSGEIVFWSHNGTTDESWSDLATWIKEVWIDGG